MRISLRLLSSVAKNMTTKAAPSAKPVLYAYAKSSCSWRVRAAFAYKNMEFDVKPYDPYGNISDKERSDYVKLNPLGQAPTLIIDGHVMTQSVAMLEYIEETHPENPLLPREPLQRAKVRQIVELINSGIQPLQNPIVARRSSNDPQKQREWQVYWMEKGLTALEKVLQETSGKYCVGDEVTFADLSLVPQMFSSRRFGADLTKFPVCVRIFDDCLTLDAFRKSHPNNQPDTPDDERGPL